VIRVSGFVTDRSQLRKYARALTFGDGNESRPAATAAAAAAADDADDNGDH